MDSLNSDRNLLVGILGLQAGIFSESQLVSAMQAWVFRKSKSLEEILVEHGAITEERKAFLTQLVQQFLSMNIRAPTEILAKIPLSKTLSDALSLLNDKDVSISVSKLDTSSPVGSMGPVDNAETITFESVSQPCDGRYRILRPHAQGGLGQVSVAEDLELHREVALKQIKAQYLDSLESRNRFLIEAEITGRLEHPGIVPVYSLGFTESGPFYVMRFIRGETLKQALEQLYARAEKMTQHEFLLELRQMVRRLVDAGNAMAYAHSRGVLHRDLKPSNIMLGKYGETLVVDWGLAKTGAKKNETYPSDEATFVPVSGDSSTETRMGAIVGTIAYMSPEQANGRLDQLGPKSDVYSLGATLYCVLTGNSPFAGLSANETLHRVRTGRFSPPRDVNVRVPMALNAICMKAMAVAFDDRYESTSAFVKDLELWLSDEPVGVYKEPFIERLVRIAKRHRSFVAASSAVLLTSIVALSVLNIVMQQQNRALKVAKDRAEDNLQMARGLSILLLTNAEEKLSAPEFENVALTRKLRTELTEASFSNYEKIFQQSDASPQLLFEFAQILRISGNLKRLERDFSTASQRLARSLELQQQIPKQLQTDEQLNFLAETFRDVGTMRKVEGRLSEAQKELASAQAIAAQSLTKQLQSVSLRRTVASIELEEIGLLEDLGKTDAALEKALSCSSRFTEIRKTDQAIASDDFLLLFVEARVVSLLSRSGRNAESEEVAKHSIAIGRQILEKKPTDGNVILPFARILGRSAENLMDWNKEPEVVSERLEEAVSRLSALVQTTKRSSYINEFANALRYQAANLRKQSLMTESDAAILKADEWMNRLVKASPTPGILSDRSEVLLERAKLKTAAGNLPAAIEILKEAQTQQIQACRLSEENASYKSILSSIELELSTSQRRQE